MIAAVNPLLTPSPMPPVPTKEVYRLVVIGEIELCMTANVFYYQGSEPVGAATVASQAALASLFGSVEGPFTPYLNCLTTDWTFTASHIDCPTQPSLATVVSTGANVNGLVPPPALANQSAVVIQKITAWRGKHGRGRISLPAVPRAWVTGTVLSNDAAAKALATAMEAVLSDGTHTFTPGILSRGTGADAGKLGWLNMRTCKVNSVLGTIRRRKPGTGK